MEQGTSTVSSARDMAFDLARWYHDLAKVCVEAAEQHMVLSEDSSPEEMEKAMAINDVIGIRMATVQSVERQFRSEFSRVYIDHHVERILNCSEEPAE
jgi:hypothetical protein